MCRGSHLDLKVASKDNKWFRNAALKQDRIVIETRATLNVAAMIGADCMYVIVCKARGICLLQLYLLLSKLLLHFSLFVLLNHVELHLKK